MDDAPIRLLLCDIDGTLVRHDKSLPDGNVAAIRNLIAREMAVSLISMSGQTASLLPSTSCAERRRSRRQHDDCQQGCSAEPAPLTRTNSHLPFRRRLRLERHLPHSPSGSA